MHIALLEDEATLAQEVKNFLEQDGHTVKVFTDGEYLVRNIPREIFDLFILDWSVPKMNGFEVLAHMRTNLRMVEPVVFLTSAGAEDDIVKALSAGADDYCVKPIRPREFLARIHSVGRRSERGATLPSLTEILGYSFDAATNTVNCGGIDVSLTEKEFKLALLLFTEVDRPISRNQLLMNVWGHSGTELSRTLDVHITWIRKKLNIGATGNRLRLAAVYGYGYRLMQCFTED